MLDRQMVAVRPDGGKSWGVAGLVGNGVSAALDLWAGEAVSFYTI
jgi:hypothetical protein